MAEPRLPQTTEVDESFVAEVSDLRDANRRRALRAAFWSARPLLANSLPLRQRLLRGLSTTAIIVLALLVISFSLQGLPDLHLFERQPPQPLALRVDTRTISFLLDMAWSPDSKQIALLGCQSTQMGPCNAAQHYVPNAVLIYDAASGALVTRIAPDFPVLAELHRLDPTDVPAVPSASALPALEGVQLLYSTVLWSPDGRELALPFFASVLPRAGLGLIWEGIVLVARDGTRPRALFAPNLVDASPLWDLVAGKPLPVPASSPDVAPQEIPDALTYRWNAGDMLLPVLPLAPDAVPPVPPLAPVGDPDGGAAFTVWQPGQVLPIGGAGPANGPNALFGFVFATTFVPWSPDGRRLAERSGRHPGAPLDVSAVLVPAGQAPPHPPGYTGRGQSAQFDYLPVRDRALQQLLDVGAVSTAAENGWIVAWRPDGRVLAAYGMSSAVGMPKLVTLYDCATGHKLATLRPQLGAGFLDGYYGGMLRWSPDGTHLLSYIQESGLLTVWGPDQLS